MILPYSRVQFIQKLREIRERLLNQIVTEDDLMFLLGCGILTPEEYQIMNKNQPQKVVENAKVKQYVLNNDVHG